MSRIINLSDKFSDEQPSIQIGDELYPVADSMQTVLKFEELASDPSGNHIVAAIEMALGQEAASKLEVAKMSMSNFKVLAAGIMAAMQDTDFEEVYARFQK